MNRDEILYWLKEKDEDKLNVLFDKANRLRRDVVGNEVHLRGLVEISNYCSRTCKYCGINAKNTCVQRYRMSNNEILSCANLAKVYGFGTIVMQAGEDYGIDAKRFSEVIKEIKESTELAITLSLGERKDEELKMWKDAGADRYLLRFETSDPDLYRKIHPSKKGEISDRIRILNKLKSLGYETGSGVMVGIPGQSYDILANDLELFVKLDLDMIGVGPYIPHPDTELILEEHELFSSVEESERVPNTELMTCKVLALTRILCPEANLPSTTALSTVNPNAGRVHGLERGANVIMPNLTPQKYRILYEIYPNKAGKLDTASDTYDKVMELLKSLGREKGKGQGGRKKKK